MPLSSMHISWRNRLFPLPTRYSHIRLRPCQVLTSAAKVLLKGPITTARADHLALRRGEAQVLAAAVVHSAEREFAWVVLSRREKEVQKSVSREGGTHVEQPGLKRTE